jgi:hypothetical protein
VVSSSVSFPLFFPEPPESVAVADRTESGITYSTSVPVGSCSVVCAGIDRAEIVCAVSLDGDMCRAIPVTVTSNLGGQVPIAYHENLRWDAIGYVVTIVY